MKKIFSLLFNFFSKKNRKVNNTRPLSDYQYNDERYIRQKKLDSILDKISEVGYTGLTKEDKDFLDRYHKK